MILRDMDDKLIEDIQLQLRAFRLSTFPIQLEKLEPAREPLLYLRCKLQREYYQAREKLRMPKDKEYTDFDRATMLEAGTAELREKYEYIKGLEDLLNDRLAIIKIQMEGK